jgi:hypothetical protein
MIRKTVILFSIFILIISCTSQPIEKLAEIIRTENGFQLLYQGKPYFVKGAVASNKFDLIKEYGGNSVRSGALTRERLGMLYQMRLTVLFGLPVRAQRDGMDYDNEQMVKEQFNRVIAKVKKMKDHPAILFWQLGNELDYVDPETPPNWKMYNAINDLAKEIHEIDTTRPVLTVLGTGKKWKLQEFIKRCPDIDLVGINAYDDIGAIPGWFKKYDFDKPFIVTEWGPTGHWQVPRTDQGIPIEENSTEKAKSYKSHHENVIMGNPGLCLGSYVFLWRQHQERTHTWYGMFDKEWRESAAVDIMRYFWTGKQPNNLAPEIISFTLDQKVAIDNIHFSGKSVHQALAEVSDPDGDELSYDWEVLPENKEFGYGGHGEIKPASVDCILGEKNKNNIKFSTPPISGNYRVFVYIYDKGGNHFAYANIPFYVD